LKKDSIVIIPTYNEKENIEKIIRKVFSLSHPFDVLIVDDGSPDGTAGIVTDLQKEFPERLHLIERSGKLGLGTAYIKGFEWSLDRNYQYIFEMDADFSHNPDDLLRLRGANVLQGGDVSVGSRYIKGGKVKNWPLSRILISYFASLYARAITGMPVHDTTAGFVCWTRDVLESIDFNKITFVGYAFQIQMKYAAWKLGFRLIEVPITFIDRELGKSKMSKNIIKEAALGVIKMRGNDYGKRKSKK